MYFRLPACLSPLFRGIISHFTEILRGSRPAHAAIMISQSPFPTEALEPKGGSEQMGWLQSGWETGWPGRRAGHSGRGWRSHWLRLEVGGGLGVMLGAVRCFQG